MMENRVLKIFVLIVMVFMAGACNDYMDVNTPSGYLEEKDLDISDVMGPVLYNTAYAYYNAELSFGNYTQYFGGYGNTALEFTSCSSTWKYIYTKSLPNIRTLLEKAEAKVASHYAAVIKIVEAMNLSLAVETWGDVPYTQAGYTFEYPYPVLDDGKTVYISALSMLNDAISALESADSSVVSIGNEDLFYGGDTDKWLRAAYTMKARMQLKMMKNGGTTADDVLASIGKGFTSNDDNIKLEFPEGELNPYYSTNILARATSNYYRAPNDQIISMMNGNSYPFESGVVKVDPRLPAIYENEGKGGDPWRGFLNGGTGESFDGEDANTYYKDGGYHTSSTASLVLLTYAEAMFIKAEAEFLANGGTETSTGSTPEAYAAYMEGIMASMDEIGVDGTDYMADTAVDVGETGLMLNHIMKEKYIANIHNVETYNDFRRYNFSPNVFKDLAIRIDDGEGSEYEGLWFRRAIYPTKETDSNPNVSYDERTSIQSIWLFE